MVVKDVCFVCIAAGANQMARSWRSRRVSNHGSRNVRGGLRSSNLPVHVGDADLLARLFVVVEPLAFIQLDAGELCACLGARGQEFALVRERQQKGG
jgi:hypothetical protein